MSQMDAALEFLNDIAEYRMNGIGESDDDVNEACAHCARYVVRAMTTETLTPQEITRRAALLVVGIADAVEDGLRVDALSFCSAE